MIFFCPQCHTYLAADSFCPACGQPRPEPPVATALWTAALDAAIYGKPVAACGLLFLLTGQDAPTQHRTLLALDLATRQVRWRHRLDNMLVNDPVLAHGDVLVVAARSADPLGLGLLLALDIATGDECWHWIPDAQAVSAPALVGGTLYVTLNSRQLWAIDAASGEAEWSLQLPTPHSVAAPAVSPEMLHRLFLPSRGPHLCAVDLDQRKKIWLYTSPEDVGDWFRATPALVGGRLFAASTGGAALALEAETGERLWRVVPGQAGKPLTAPMADDRRVYVGGHDRCVYVLDAASGETLWRRETGRRLKGRPLLVDDVLYVTGYDHNLRALDSATGVELWHVELSRSIKSGPAVSGDLVLAADRAGNVVAVERVLNAEVYASQDRWAEAAVAYARVGRWEAAAIVWCDRMHDLAAAAAAFTQAARVADSDYAAANFWERARDCCQKLGDDERAEECQRQAARLRRQPYIQVRVIAPEVMILGNYHEVACEVTNAGGEVARQVFLRHTESDFAGDLKATQQIHDVPPGRSAREVLYVRPLAAGQRVPLDVTVTYADATGQIHQVPQRVLLTVQRPEELQGEPSPFTSLAEDSPEAASLRRQLAEARENLRLIEEREAEFVLGTDVPLQLRKEKRRLRKCIVELERRLAAL